MSTNLTSQLNSRDPRARREAIMMIGKTKNRSYLHELKQLSLNDPDDDLRVLAQKAINHLQKQGTGSTPSLLKTSAVGGALKGNEPGFIRTTEQKIEDKKRTTSTQKSTERSAVLVDLLIFMVVVLVAAVAFALFILPLVREALLGSLQPLIELVPSLGTTASVLRDEATLQPNVLIVVGLALGGIAILSAFFNNFIFHLAARIMGGLESYGSFMRKSFVPYAVFTVLFTVVAGALAFIPSEMSPLRTVDQIGAISSLIGILFFVVAFIWLARFIGRTYEMGIGRGFVAVLIGGLLIGVVLFGLQLAAGALRPTTG
jgi:hypothetical protein